MKPALAWAEKSTQLLRMVFPSLRQILWLAVLIDVALTTLPLPAQRQIPDYLQPVIANLDKIATQAVADPENGSYVVAVVDKSGIVWIKSYGYADVERKIAATPTTVYRVYSMTKPFTALMLLQLVHDGKVHFSDPAQLYFPPIAQLKPVNPKAAPITLLQLATHTSGLPVGAKEYNSGPPMEWEKQLGRALSGTSFESEPGTVFKYSNIGYGVLGAALAHAAHVEYPHYVKAHVLQPLGMTRSGFEQPADGLAIGYVVKDGKLDSSAADAVNKNGVGYKLASGGLFSDGEDMAKFLAFLMGGGPDTVLPAPDLQANYDRIVVSSGDLQSGFGIGFQAFTPVDWGSTSATFLGHTGGEIGYTNAILFETHVKVGLLVLHNDGRSNKGWGQLLGAFVHDLDITKALKSDTTTQVNPAR